ncbi:glutaredoxin family protein [Rheinheimera mesophila]|uniref:Glutaredoxin family protein n=1 Tax=Rheinheimera mesophila TaxID=1547515 RepID=A0A3P3QR51_9GAMM|nr:glutaredoxin family protein [Rheinheimera mesophila]KKK99805.1 glutaredoxin [Rheinheimera mesophila]RRJ22783.1 glutaredoxin family protein [Rheinheimera mesophila]
MRLTLYSTWGCHLCEQAEQLLLQAGLAGAVEIIDIVDDPAAFERYRVHIPVFKVNEQELFWPFDLVQIKQLLAQSAG